MKKILENFLRRINVKIEGKKQVGIYNEKTGKIKTTKGEIDIKDVEEIVNHGKINKI